MQPPVNGEARSLILLDVDGVLNVPMLEGACGSGVVQDYWGYSCQVWYNPETGPLLLELAEQAGGELAWATMWENRANQVVGPLLGLPWLQSCPVSGGRLVKPNGYPLKAASVVPWTGGRPFVWFEDEPEETGAARQLAEAYGYACLIVEVDECEGLTRECLSQAREWLMARSWETAPVGRLARKPVSWV